VIEVLQHIPKGTFRNYLSQRQELILAGVENYLRNYTFLLRLKEDMAENKTTKKIDNSQLSHSPMPKNK
jgi:hypothetical protein